MHVCTLLLLLGATARIRAFTVAALAPGSPKQAQTLPESSAWLLWPDGARTRDSVRARGRERFDNFRDLINNCRTTRLH